MAEYEIEGVTVNFPYEAYPCQIKYMERVIACLNKGWNGVLESPTGTGKTLCLLCACLAWQQQRKRQLLEQNVVQQMGYGSSSLGPVLGSQNVTSNPCIKYPKILYTSRTHMQLSQVIRELNKTVYKTVKTCLLGSRDQLCINEDVKNEQNSSIKNHMCRAKVKTRTCQYYNGFNAYELGAKKVDALEQGTTGALDIEDFISFGRRQKICPFFASRDKPEEADLLLMPYNYVVDYKARKANKIDLNNVILIFDEAHNLEKVCEESASFTLTTKDVAGSLRESKEALNMILIDEESLRREMDETKLAFGATNEDIPQLKIDVKELADMIMLLESLEKEIDKIDMQKQKSTRNSLPGLTMSGNFLLDLLQQAGIHALMRDAIYNLIDKVTSYLTQKATNSVWQSRGVSLQKFASLVNTIFSEDGDDEHDLATPIEKYKNHGRHFKVYVCGLEEEKRTSTTLTSFVKNVVRHQSLQLNYWCFNAGLTMEALAAKGVYSVLVTSGTLSPLNHFTTEMRIPFQLSLQNEHVVEAKQSWFGVICQGPDGCPLDASYANRQNDSYLNSLGNLLVNTFRLVPEGCLVFFASYSQMTTCIEKWQENEIWNRMSKHKAMYVEPKSKEQFYQVINEYNNVVKSRPAAFFAVCRGKVSEGIDFADSAARAVVVMGIPYPPMLDPKVVLKKEFLAGQFAEKSGSHQDGVALDGETWYRTEAIRAVNQSIGRVIRHKDDYGAVILADQRFASWNRDRFPSWIVSNYATYKKFGEFSKSLAQFFIGKGVKKEEFTAIVKKEAGFEKNSSLRQRDFEGERKGEEIFYPKKVKFDSDSRATYSVDYVDTYASSSEPYLKKKPEPNQGNMWQALESGVQQVEKPETFAPYEPNLVRKANNKITQSTIPRQRIKIKRDEIGETKNDGGKAEEKSPEIMQKSAEYIKMAKRRLKPDEFKQFIDLVKTYKEDYRFEPVFRFLKQLPFGECADILKGFILFVRSQHKTVYSAFLEQAEQGQG